MARTLVANQTTAQQQNARTPYIKMVFYSANYNATDTYYARAYATNSQGTSYGSEVTITTLQAGTSYDFSTDSSVYGNRILLIDDTEKPYERHCLIILQDYDRTIPDLTGYYTEICYGDTYSGTNYYEGGRTARVWVKSQETVSTMGRIYTFLKCAGTWEVWSEQVFAWGDAPLFQEYLDTEDGEIIPGTVIDVMRNILVNMIIRVTNYLGLLGMEDIALVGTSDGIIDDYVPNLLVNQDGMESVGRLMWYLINMTKCVIRIRHSNDIEVIYPQTTDSVTQTYYSYQQHYFYEYTSVSNVTTPNRVILYGKIDPELDWNEGGNLITATASESTQIAKYFDVLQYERRPNINNYADALEQAEVLLERLQNHDVTGKLTIPHDASVELYDKVGIVDTRGV